MRRHVLVYMYTHILYIRRITRSYNLRFKRDYKICPIPVELVSLFITARVSRNIIYIYIVACIIFHVHVQSGLFLISRVFDRLILWVCPAWEYTTSPSRSFLAKMYNFLFFAFDVKLSFAFSLLKLMLQRSTYIRHIAIRFNIQYRMTFFKGKISWPFHRVYNSDIFCLS